MGGAAGGRAKLKEDMRWLGQAAGRHLAAAPLLPPVLVRRADAPGHSLTLHQRRAQRCRWPHAVGQGESERVRATSCSRPCPSSSVARPNACLPACLLHPLPSIGQPPPDLLTSPCLQVDLPREWLRQGTGGSLTGDARDAACWAYAGHPAVLCHGPPAVPQQSVGLLPAPSPGAGAQSSRVGRAGALRAPSSLASAIHGFLLPVLHAIDEFPLPILP